MQKKNENLEKINKDIVEERTKTDLSNVATCNDSVSLKSQLYELGVKYDNVVERHIKDLMHQEHLHQVEKEKLLKRISGMYTRGVSIPTNFR